MRTVSSTKLFDLPNLCELSLTQHSCLYTICLKFSSRKCSSTLWSMSTSIVHQNLYNLCANPRKGYPCLFLYEGSPLIVVYQPGESKRHFKALFLTAQSTAEFRFTALLHDSGHKELSLQRTGLQLQLPVCLTPLTHRQSTFLDMWMYV